MPILVVSFGPGTSLKDKTELLMRGKTNMWTPVETQFYAKQNPIGIINIGDFQKAHTIRTFAEELNLAVRFYGIGTPGDL